MALEPITRKEQIIAGKDLQPITRTEKFLKQYGGASSWNDLKDKPFGEEVVSIDYHNDNLVFEEGFANLPEGFSLKEGNAYTVIWDGTTYNLTASLHGFSWCVGNPSFDGWGDETGEPFGIYYNTWGSYIGTTEPGNHSVTIKGESLNIRAISPQVVKQFVVKIEIGVFVEKNFKYADLIRAAINDVSPTIHLWVYGNGSVSCVYALQPSGDMTVYSSSTFSEPEICEHGLIYIDESKSWVLMKRNYSADFGTWYEPETMFTFDD